jgi:hypothetical protein
MSFPVTNNENETAEIVEISEASLFSALSAPSAVMVTGQTIDMRISLRLGSLRRADRG